MGTNYYLHKPSTTRCEHCGHDPENNIVHVGKSSYGWCFALHVHPELGINSLEDWVGLWSQPGMKIINEYEEPILPGDMLTIITARGPGKWSPERMEPQRHEVDGVYCLSRGEGSWDHMAGEFS